jgi:DNA-binding GntR family transcriptional regulator
VESVLAELYGVSRTPIRDALSRLEQDGLVVRRDRSLVVRARSPEEILDIYETRIVLEVKAAVVAAERHTSFDAMQLGRALRGNEKANVADADGLVSRNRELHGTIWQASHNQTLIDLLERLNLHLVRYPATTLVHEGRWDEALREHRALVDAILERDAAAAAREAKRHFTRALEIRLELWEQEL